MARDTLSEIADIRARSGRGPQRHLFALQMLREVWETGGLDSAHEFVPIRLVTILEVFTQSWVAELIDSGEPYITRSADLAKNGVKIDFSVARALTGQKVTIGELIAHALSIYSIEALSHAFTTILGTDFFNLLPGVIPRWKTEVLGEPPQPCISDMPFVRTQIAELFKVRHILVHELPLGYFVEKGQVDNFLKAAAELIEAADQALATLLHGAYPLTQADMNITAAESAAVAEGELAEVIAALDPTRSDEELLASQEAWTAYRGYQSAYRSQINRPGHGSIAPLIYSSEFETITRERIRQLRWYLEREEGDM